MDANKNSYPLQQIIVIQMLQLGRDIVLCMVGWVWVATITTVVIDAINVHIPRMLKNRNVLELEGFCGLPCY